MAKLALPEEMKVSWPKNTIGVFERKGIELKGQKVHFSANSVVIFVYEVVDYKVVGEILEVSLKKVDQFERDFTHEYKGYQRRPRGSVK